MLSTRFFLVAGLLSAANYVLALQNSRACDDLLVNIANNSDVEFYSSCPELELVFIDHTYSGPFELPGVKSVGKFTAGYLEPKYIGSDRVDDGVTSISMPDLETTSIGGILLAYLAILTSISFPKLNNISGELVIIDNDGVKKLTLPELSTVRGGMLVDGDFDEIHLPNLKSVAYLIVKSIGSLDCPALGKNLSSLTFNLGTFNISDGFTCWTPHENNRYNSSDPTQSSAAASSSSTSLTGVTSAKPTSSKSEAGNSAHMRFPGVLLCSIAAATFGGLLS